MLEDSEEERVPGFPGARRTALLCSSEEHVESTHVATYASSRIQQDNYTKDFYVTTAGMNLSAGVTWQQICTTETCGAVCISVLVVAITIAFLKFMMDRKYGEYPPATSYSFREFLDSFITGQVHRHHIKMCKESGPVYRIPIIGWNSLFIVHDPTVAKIIMEGDSKHGIPESEKSLRYKTLTKLTCGVQTMLTKRTNDENWQTSRKAVAPSFSMTNLYQVLPELSVKLNQFKDILDAHVLQGKQLIDLPEWMIRVTIDVLATSMFRTDYHTLKIHSLGRGIIDVDKSLGDSSKATPSETDGERFVRSVPIMSREYIMRGALQPFRKYKFWDKQIMKEIAEADEAALAVYHISKNVLQEYRQRHTKEELEGDKSILAHLIRRYVS